MHPLQYEENEDTNLDDILWARPNHKTVGLTGGGANNFESSWDNSFGLAKNNPKNKEYYYNFLTIIHMCMCWRVKN